MKMFHWFCFCYVGKLINSSNTCYGSTYVGLDNTLITKKIIDDNKINANVDNEAVLISSSYLGYMTKEKMDG